jgi:chromosome segregation ATPase
VTAAHEALHAVYERLSYSERERLNRLLEDYYAHGLTDQRVKDEIELYKKSEPDSVLDEMHSTFGTEISQLPPDLEKYYKKYFYDRTAVSALSQRYEQAFTSRQAKISRDDRRLAFMKQQIDSLQTDLHSQLEELNVLQAKLQASLSAGDTGQYNNGVFAYNAQVNAYNTGVARLKILISEYNKLVAARNAVAAELTTLDKALDSRSAPEKQPTN